MPTFAEFLRDSYQLPEARIPHYERWVHMYRQTLQATGALEGSGTDSSPLPFLESLAGKYAKWQIAQAKHAIQLYWYYTRKN